MTSTTPPLDQQPTTLTVDQLDQSPWNVRTNAEDQHATTALEASLLNRGQIMPLSCHPLKGNKGKYGVFAGGRRLRAFKKLVARGDLPRDHPVLVVIRDLSETELLELSLTENLIRRELRAYEIFAAVVRAHRRGESAEALHEALGQPLQTIRRWLRAGELAPPIFKALSEDRISLDAAYAYAATGDQALQLAAYQEMEKRPPNLRTPEAVRAFYKFDDRDHARLLRFVGEERYREAGGAYELDLFAAEAEHRGRVADPGKLRALADQLLRQAKKDARRRAGHEVRFLREPPRTDAGTDWELHIEPKAGPQGSINLPDGDVVATIAIGAEGDAELRWWWASRKAKREALGPKAKPRNNGRDEPKRPPTGVATGIYASVGVIQHANSEIRHETGVGGDGVAILLSLRRAALRAILLQDAVAGGARGRDYLTWSQLRLAHPDTIDPEVGTGRLREMSPDPYPARGHLEATPAFQQWEAARRMLLAHPAFTGQDRAAALEAYLALDEDTKRLAEAIAAGIALERSLNFDKYECPTHDALAAACGMADDATLRRLLPPTHELLGLISRDGLLAIAEPLVGPDELASWHHLKQHELATRLLSVLTGTVALATREQQEAARDWSLELLKFKPPEPEPAAVAAQPAAELEAAE